MAYKTDKESIRKRFMDKVYMEPNSGCWLWTGATTGGGYGTVTQNYKQMPAHRCAYEMFVGEIPKDKKIHKGTMYVLHKCDVRSCVNPNHLFLGTQKDNVDDMVNKGRFTPPGVKGSQNGKSKLNEFQVRIINRLLSLRTMTQKEIGEIFSVADCTISTIKRGYCWGHVKMKEI